MHLINLRLVLDVLSCNLLLHAVITSPFNAMRGSSRHSYMAFLRILQSKFIARFSSFSFLALLLPDFWLSFKRYNNNLITRCALWWRFFCPNLALNFGALSTPRTLDGVARFMSWRLYNILPINSALS